MYPLKIPEKYDKNKLEKLANRFTTCYLWNYIPWDYSSWNWSHPWVDIVPTKTNDDVYCILDWIVEKAENSSSIWNYVVIKHIWVKDPNDFSKTTTLYSCYLHLSEFSVSAWNNIKEWDILWKTWSTWMSYWEHLHFQIDRKEAIYHAYWPYSTTDTNNAWVWFLEWVNLWLWLDNAKKCTIDPLVYLDNLEKNIIENWYFSDVDKSFEYFDYLNDLANNWKIKWYEDWTFKPNNNITRAEVLKMIFVLSWKKLKDDSENYFNDVKATDWFKKYVNSWVNYKIISTSNKDFKPSNYISKVEALKIILLLLVWEIPNLYTKSFKDVSSNEWFAKYVEYTINNDLLEISWEYFEPTKFITRWEIITILYRLW